PKAFEKDPFEACKTATMGTGPYMYAINDGEKSYTFVRNPHYWGEKPEADGFVIKVIADNDSKMIALKSGEIDAVIGSSRIAYDAYHQMSGREEFQGKVSERGNLTDYIGMNLFREPFNDAKVRRAVSHAID
ncbi:peptide ABC transporter substrate-binding protein, partial [Bacillus licheniformis]|uniref:ABC transporter substrate-binding protein n=1 Tax=Bacillus licheniformis TaxID=1402 RepID=UPI000FA2D8E8